MTTKETIRSLQTTITNHMKIRAAVWIDVKSQIRDSAAAIVRVGLRDIVINDALNGAHTSLRNIASTPIATPRLIQMPPA